MNDNRLIPETLTQVGEASGTTIVEIRTNTKITNTLHLILLKDVAQATGLDPADVAQKASETARDKSPIINGEQYVRLSTVRAWNLASMQSTDAEQKTQAQQFQKDTQCVLSRPESTRQRAIAATTVNIKSEAAKKEFRQNLAREGKDEKCERSGESTASQQTAVHHKKRVADHPELAAETSNMELLLHSVHIEEHRNDKKG